MRAAMALPLVLLGLSACALQMDLPPEFLRLHAQEAGDLRAVTADDARIWVRDLEVDDGATLDFWMAALASDLRDARGYELTDDGAIEDGEGRQGKALRASVVVEGERCGWFAAVFLLPGGMLSHDHVRVVEFAARQHAFDAQIDAVRAAVASLR
jgi:hypothetical protein